MAVYKRGRVWWYKFTWKGEPIRESTKQTNKRVAEQIEAAHKTSLAKGEVGIREKKRAPTFGEFRDKQFLPWAESTFSAKRKTWLYYRNGVRRLRDFSPLASVPLDDRTISELRKRFRVTSRIGNPKGCGCPA